MKNNITILLIILCIMMGILLYLIFHDQYINLSEKHLIKVNQLENKVDSLESTIVNFLIHRKDTTYVIYKPLQIKQ